MKHQKPTHPDNHPDSHWAVYTNGSRNKVLLQINDGEQEAHIILTPRDVVRLLEDVSKCALRIVPPSFKSEPGNALCYSCKYRGTVPGSCHSSCSAYSARVKANDHGTKMGWFIWPLNFDPVWLESCTGYEPKMDEDKTQAPARSRDCWRCHAKLDEGNNVGLCPNCIEDQHEPHWESGL